LGSSPTSEVRQTYYAPDAASAPCGALKTLQLQQGSNAHLATCHLSYDAAGNVASLTDVVHGETSTYGDGDLDRLTSAGGPVSETYGYSAIGNLTSKNG
jgi:uncharacterized protein RhaS with RHS repeats